MQGVRRFLGAATAPSLQPQPPPQSPQSELQQSVPSFTPKPGPSWPPEDSTVSPADSPPKTTPALVFRRDKSSRPQPPPFSPNGSTNGLNGAKRASTSSAGSPLSPTRTPFSPSQSKPPPPLPDYIPNSRPSAPSSPVARIVTRKPVAQPDEPWERSSAPLNTRDELLMSLLASEAVIDCRDLPILTSEEVDDLKKEHQVLTSRLEAMQKKLTLETKIRDAAMSLVKVNASHKKVSKQTDDQLEAANRRVDEAQKEYWRISERVNDINKKLFEHRAGVLSYSVRAMERKLIPGDEDSGYDTSNRSTLMSPTGSSITGVSTSSKARFDGAHLFAGHADAIIPRRQLGSEAAANEISSLEDKLKAATESLVAAGKKQADMTRELTHMRLEKEQVETMLGMELQNAEEMIMTLKADIPRLEDLESQVQQLRGEQLSWQRDRTELKERAQQVSTLQDRLAKLEANSAQATDGQRLLADLKESTRQELDRKDDEIRFLREQWEADKATWARERTRIENDKLEERNRLREADAAAVQRTNDELDGSLATLRALIQRHGIVLFSRESSLQGLLQSVGTHLEGVHAKLDLISRDQADWELVRRRLEDDVRSGLDKREAMARELEEARKARDDAKRETLEQRKDQFDSLRSPSSPYAPLVSEFNGDPSNIIAALQPLWAILPSPEARAAKFSQKNFRTGSPTQSPGNNVMSLSELDVRSLKSLYDLRAGTPLSPKPSTFTIEAFVAKVQALVADDRALIERLVRFAQAHDLLKKNAERAQKLAQDGNAALETYQKQVKTLEERNMNMTVRQSALQDEIQHLQETVDQLTVQKQEVEMLAAEQAETCRQLSEANNVLSAKTLTLAEEAARAPEMVRKQLEGQLTECRMALEQAKEDVERMRLSEQSQSMALLDELNTVQTENGNLRAQLRAAKK